MDFIEQLPDSKGFTAILVVVDHYTKQALFIPTHDTITSAQFVMIFPFGFTFTLPILSLIT
jgi:hypothetical protein